MQLPGISPKREQACSSLTRLLSYLEDTVLVIWLVDIKSYENKWLHLKMIKMVTFVFYVFYHN